MKFFDAIEKAGKIFGYQVTLQLEEYRQLYRNGRIRRNILEQVIRKNKGAENLETWMKKLTGGYYETSVPARIGAFREQWKKYYDINLDDSVQPLLFRILCAYLDQGIALIRFPLNKDGFLASLRELEKNSHSSFFRSKRTRRLLNEESLGLHTLLKILVGEEEWYEHYLFDQQFSHRGWSGIVSAFEDRPDALLDQRKITLRELILLDLLLEIDAMDARFGEKWKPLATHTGGKPQPLFGPVEYSELNDVFRLWQEAFEWSYYDEVLAGLAEGSKTERNPAKERSFQAIFCIDERECSLRRHLETVDPACETLGSPGFFGVEFFFQPENGKFYDKLCPAPVTPKYLIKETQARNKRKHEPLYHKYAHTFLIGSVFTLSLGFWAAVKLFLLQFRPKMSPAISDAFGHMGQDSELSIENKHPDDTENGLQIGFTVEEMAARVEALLRSIGLIQNFAPLVYVVAHGSSSANNPHHGAHDCGACSGRPGSVNARVFAHMANHAGVRELLRARGIAIPETTRFVGCLHDTAADQIEYYDVKKINTELHKTNASAFEQALDLNAKERSRRFASIPTRQPIRHIRRAIRLRSVSLFEPRPELGHGTNTLCIIGSRDITKNVFLDRRAFLNSYDYRTDPEGKLLTGVMRPIGPVCGGINLEYYFSRVDNHKLGAGTKLPHNVMGLFGVANSCDGDLRPGLPVQMIEVHDPVRLLIIVEHYPDVVLKTIQSAPEMYEWYINEWVHLVALDPATKQFHYFNHGQFSPYQPLKTKTEVVKDFHRLVENASGMETNQIADATTENLPVFTIQRS